MAPRSIAPHEGRTVMNGFVVHKLSGTETGGTLAIVEHVLEPGMLGAPLHTHRNEDEYSYVLEGELTALIGGELIHAHAGALVCKPRGIPHTFWNQSSQQTRLLELIAPGGFEAYFDRLDAAVSVNGPPDVGQIRAIAQTMVWSSTSARCRRFHRPITCGWPVRDRRRVAGRTSNRLESHCSRSLYAARASLVYCPSRSGGIQDIASNDCPCSDPAAYHHGGPLHADSSGAQPSPRRLFLPDAERMCRRHRARGRRR